MHAAAVAIAFVALAGCASWHASDDEIPPLRLAPAQLGHPLDLQQHLRVHAGGRVQELDVLLEADATRVRLGVVALGQSAARLDWDGTTLDEWRAPWWPAAVSGARVLEQVELALWPVDAIRAALPAGWTLEERDAVRTLAHGARVVATVTRAAPDRLEIAQRDGAVRVTIVSRPAGEGGTP